LKEKGKQCKELEESISTLTPSIIRGVLHITSNYLVHAWIYVLEPRTLIKPVVIYAFFFWERKCVGYAVISRDNGPTHPTSEYTH
jgi:hypothetical protein